MLITVKWIVGSILVGALLWGTHSVVRMNDAAMGGPGQPAGFYGH